MYGKHFVSSPVFYDENNYIGSWIPHVSNKRWKSCTLVTFCNAYLQSLSSCFLGSDWNTRLDLVCHRYIQLPVFMACQQNSVSCHNPTVGHQENCSSGCYQTIMSSIGGGEVLPGFHLLLSSVTMSTPLIRFSQNSSKLSDSGKRPEIPAMTISSMLNCCEKSGRAN